MSELHHDLMIHMQVDMEAGLQPASVLLMQNLIEIHLPLRIILSVQRFSPSFATLSEVIHVMDN